MLRVNETCSCGANLKISGRVELVLRQVRLWRKGHICLKQDSEDSVTSGNSDTQLAMGFQPGELPAKKYDPWEDE
jgi:hypothetical protein